MLMWKQGNVKVATILFGFFLFPSGPIAGQRPEPSSDENAIKQAVETYLYAEEAAQVARVVDQDAKIFSVKSDKSRVIVTSPSKPAKKLPKDVRSRVPRQRIVNIDRFSDAAVVTVETDRFTDEQPAVPGLLHRQYISLLKVSGEWKIVSILMPSATLSQN